jgi:hypothetical protein
MLGVIVFLALVIWGLAVGTLMGWVGIVMAVCSAFDAWAKWDKAKADRLAAEIRDLTINRRIEVARVVDALDPTDRNRVREAVALAREKLGEQEAAYSFLDRLPCRECHATKVNDVAAIAIAMMGTPASRLAVGRLAQVVTAGIVRLDHPNWSGNMIWDEAFAAASALATIDNPSGRW